MNVSSSDSPPVTCPRCGEPLPEEAPAQLCPRCLLAQSLESEAGAESGPPPSPLSAVDCEELNAHFPQLEILGCLGRGGMGVVYRARQKSLNREVALKLLAPERAEDPEFADRFQKEAQALATLSHPNIVTIYDFGKAGAHYFLLMEFVDGVNLRQAMNAGRFTPEEALAIVPPVCEALQYAHDRGVVHRDIKPENLLLDKEGRVKIADFGVARMISTPPSAAPADGTVTTEPVTAAPTRPGGTPQYMAPEQIEDPAQADHRVDIYAMGVVLYELLTGQAPPQGEIPPPSRQVQVDVRIDEIVLRALETEPQLRFATAAEFSTEVNRLASPSAARKPLLPVPAWTWTTLASLLVIPSLFTAGMLVAEGLEEFHLDANNALLALAALGSIVAVISLFRRTAYLLRQPARERASDLAPDWLGGLALVLAGLSGLLGLVSLSHGPAPLRLIDPLVWICAVLGVGYGVLSWGTSLGKGAVGVGGANLFLAALFASLHAAPRDSGFEPVREMTLPACAEPDYPWFDLESGRLKSMGEDPSRLDLTDDEEAVMRWKREHGIDFAVSMPPGKGKGLVGLDTGFAAVPVQDSQWKELSAGNLAHLLQAAHLSPWLPVESPGTSASNLPGSRTFAFRTREQNTGLLQILGSSTNPPGLAIRYKLAQLPHLSRSSASGSRILAEGEPVFAAPVESVVPMGAPCCNHYFQFRNGQVFSIGRGPATTSEEYDQDWKIADDAGGVDFFVLALQDGLQIAGKGCIFTSELNPDWDQTTASEVVSRLRHATWTRGVIEPKTSSLPATYLFRTATGGQGILQVLAIVPDERGFRGSRQTGRGMKFRYRLVRSNPQAS